MLVSDIAIAIACGAFLVTQIHLWRVAKRLIKKSDDSWADARKTIFESSKVIHDDVVAQVASIDISGLPGVIEDRFLKLQGGLRESFVTFGDSLAKNLETLIPKAPGGFRGGNPGDAQAASVEARKVNQIVGVLDAGSLVGGAGDIVAAAQDLGQVLQELGEPSLAEWLTEHPNTIPKIYSIASRHPRLANQMQAFQNRFSRVPGNSPHGSRGGEK